MDELRAIVARHAGCSRTATPMPRVAIMRSDAVTTPMSSLYEPILCFVLQGAKRAMIGDAVLTYDAASYFIGTVDVPATAQITVASPQRPYLVASLVLDPAMIASVILDMPPRADEDTVGAGFAVSPVTADLVDVWLRMLRLIERPGDVAMLAPMLERELIYRLLQGPQGGLLRQIARPDGRLSHVRRAIAWIRQNYGAPFRVEDLAGLAGMSSSAFHRHFKAVTAMSPLQFQKRIRLQEARRLLLAEAPDAARVAFAVGYESPSQFSREYARQFGAPPMRDAARLRQGYAAASI